MNSKYSALKKIEEIIGLTEAVLPDVFGYYPKDYKDIPKHMDPEARYAYEPYVSVLLQRRYREAEKRKLESMTNDQIERSKQRGYPLVVGFSGEYDSELSKRRVEKLKEAGKWDAEKYEEYKTEAIAWAIENDIPI